MAHSISFVIPVLNEQGGIGRHLQDLRRRYPGVELVVVDGGSADSTVAEAMPLCHQLMMSSPGRAAQMNLGARVAAGDYLFFLHGDTRPSIAVEDLGACLADNPAWGFSRVRLSGDSFLFRVIEWWMNRRSSCSRVATGDQMLYLRRELFERTGGFAEIPLMEDVEYCKRLRSTGAPAILPGTVTTSSRRWEERGVVRTVLVMWWLRFAYLLGVSPARLHRQYYGH